MAEKLHSFIKNTEYYFASDCPSQKKKREGRALQAKMALSELRDNLPGKETA